MSWQDNTIIFLENYVVGSQGSNTTFAGNVIDTQGSDNVTTNSKAAGFGAGANKYLVVNAPVGFSSVTSVDIKLRTSDTVSGSALSGTIVTLFDTTAQAASNIAGAGTQFPTTPTIVPKNGALQYLDVLVTVVGPTSNEVGSITAYLTEDVNELQPVSYGTTYYAY